VHPRSDPRWHDPDDPLADEARMDGIVLAALGEPMEAELAAHIETCPECQIDAQSLAATVRAARDPDPHVAASVAPPPAVWEGISAAIAESRAPSSRPAPSPSPGLQQSVTSLSVVPGGGSTDGAAGAIPPTSRDASAQDGRRRRGPARWLAAAAAAVVLAVGAGAIGYTLGDDRSSEVTASCETARADLGEMPGGPVGAGGSAEVVCGDEGPALRVRTDALPPPTGYYEVWLYSPTSDIMIGIGTLGADGDGSFTLPAGVDLEDFRVVDVSHQHLNGDPSHDQSVLQGPFSG
jgi:hypothetical protein